MARWKPSRTKAREFAAKMEEIDIYCREHGIEQSRTSDSYYFTFNGIKYRVSNHSIEASNAAAYDTLYGKTRELYHPNGREEGTRYIHGSKTRIIEIYEAVTSGKTIDGRGNIVK